jgi:hypothetical protein
VGRGSLSKVRNAHDRQRKVKARRKRVKAANSTVKPTTRGRSTARS